MIPGIYRTLAQQNAEQLRFLLKQAAEQGIDVASIRYNDLSAYEYAKLTEWQEGCLILEVAVAVGSAVVVNAFRHGYTNQDSPIGRAVRVNAANEISESCGMNPWRIFEW